MAERLSAAERGLVARLCRDYRRWAPGELQQPTPGPVLHGGYNNLVLVINGQHQRWVLRARRETSKGMCDFATELRVHLAAAQAGIAPKVHFSDSHQGFIVMDFIENEPLDSGDTSALNALARLLREIHALPSFGVTMNSFVVLRRYQDLIQADDHRDGGIADTLKRYATAIADAMQRIETDGRRNPVLCHNDLLRANWMRSGSRLVALDWEYAAPGDRFFDLAVCSSTMSEDSTNKLLASYLQRPPKEQERNQLRAQAVIYRCIEACWYHVHHPASPAARRSCASLKHYFSNEMAA